MFVMVMNVYLQLRLRLFLRNFEMNLGDNFDVVETTKTYSTFIFGHSNCTFCLKVDNFFLILSIDSTHGSIIIIVWH